MRRRRAVAPRLGLRDGRIPTSGLLARVALVTGLVMGLGACLAVALVPRSATAAPPVGEENDPSGASTSESGDGAYDPKREGFQLPGVVEGGRTFEFRAPAQVGLVGFRPRVRLELGGALQVGSTHWVRFGAGALLDRAGRSVLAPELDQSLEPCVGACPAGTVVGGLLRVGYAWRPTFQRRPWLSPSLHASVVGGAWHLPSTAAVGRTLTGQLGLEAGAGLRIFLTERVGLGADLDVQLDVLIHRNATADLDTGLGVGLGIFPLVLEVRG